MKLRVFLLSIIALAVSTAIKAQSPSAQIKEIQKDPATYINAESTAPSEDEAQENAMRQMIDMARNFVDTNNDGADISDASIKTVVKRIVMERGDFKRVFLYARRDDLLSKSGRSEQNGNDQIQTHKSSTETPDQKVDDKMLISESLTDNELSQPDESDSGTINSPEEFEQSVSRDIVANVRKSSEISAAIMELIESLHNSKSLQEASNVLHRYKLRRTVSDYGVPKKTRNSSASYWVVEDNGQISVLGPEIRGHRNNFRTGKTDALHRYKKGIWFRKR